MTSDKEIKAYVRQYHEDGRLEELPPVLVTHCMIKGYIECHLMFAGYITIQLTTLGETWLYHTDAGKRALGTDTGDGGSTGKRFIAEPDPDRPGMFRVMDTQPTGVLSMLHSLEHAQERAEDCERERAEIDAEIAARNATPCIQPFTPVVDSAATGYRVGQSLLAKDKYDVEFFDGRIRTVAYELEQTHARYIMQTLNEETRFLREQNARLQQELDKARDENKVQREHIEDLRADNVRLREERKALQKAVKQALGKIQHARDLQFEQKYHAADSAMKNAEVYLIGFATENE